MFQFDFNRHEVKYDAYGLWLYENNAENAFKMYKKMGNEYPGERTFRWQLEQLNKGAF